MQLAEIQTNKQVSMTSLQIAELCDKRHDSVKRTIEILSKPTDKRRAVIARPQSVIVQNVVNNRTYDTEVYVFSGEQGRLDSITIVAQLNPQFTAALVARWDELEKQAAKPQIALPQDYLSALKALVESEESKQALLVEYNEIKPKADAHDLLAGARGSFSIRAAAGELKVPERKFIQWLLDNDWAFREGNRQDGKLMPHAHRKEQGYLELVNTVAYNTGEPVARFQMKVTQKGIARLAQILSKHRAFLTHKINDCEVMA